MKKAMTLAMLIVAATLGAIAQEVVTAKKDMRGGFEFTDGKINPASGVRNQQSSGTCWAFSAVSMLESELIRNGKGEYDLSDMWIVRNNYREKAIRYVRMHGNLSFEEGSITPNVFDIYKKYGIVPEEAYRGLEYGSETHRHQEICSALKAYLDVVIKNSKLSESWLRVVDGILDAYFGPKPEKFTYQGKEYTPKSFTASLGLNPDDYITITSFTHHPFHTSFVLEVPDNWASCTVYNVQMGELEKIIDSSLAAGHNVVWASDVSERGFRYNNGYAIMPAGKAVDLTDSEKAKWSTLTDKEIDSMSTRLTGPVPEITPTQALRQQSFDDYQTTDDHGMEIIGVATDQKETKYYKVKNSWGTDNVYKGHFYASVPFVLLKTTAIAVNRNALPKDITKKLGLK